MSDPNSNTSLNLNLDGFESQTFSNVSQGLSINPSNNKDGLNLNTGSANQYDNNFARHSVERRNNSQPMDDWSYIPESTSKSLRLLVALVNLPVLSDFIEYNQ